MNFRAFARKYPVRIGSKIVAENPNFVDALRGTTHYEVTLRLARETAVVFYSMGPAHCREPEAKEVLECLVLDAVALGATFVEWCSDAGYDTDSRKAERTYAACRENALKLQNLLGVAGYRALREVEF